MFASGTRQMDASDEVVITDAARERANELGVRILRSADSTQSSASAAKIEHDDSSRQQKTPALPTTSEIQLARSQSLSDALVMSRVRGHASIVDAIVSVFQKIGKHAPTAAEVREVVTRVIRSGH
jgi:hypothetical protein